MAQSNPNFCLKWKNFSSLFMKNLSVFYTKQRHCDATIVCDGKFYPAHRLILSISSKYFEDLFDKAQCNHPFIIVKDITSSQLENLIHFIYEGKIVMPHEEMPRFLKLAESFGIRGIVTNINLLLQMDNFMCQKSCNEPYTLYFEENHGFAEVFTPTLSKDKYKTCSFYYKYKNKSSLFADSRCDGEQKLNSLNKKDFSFKSPDASISLEAPAINSNILMSPHAGQRGTEVNSDKLVITSVYCKKTCSASEGDNAFDNTVENCLAKRCFSISDDTEKLKTSFVNPNSKKSKGDVLDCLSTKEKLLSSVNNEISINKEPEKYIKRLTFPVKNSATRLRKSIIDNTNTKKPNENLTKSVDKTKNEVGRLQNEASVDIGIKENNLGVFSSGYNICKNSSFFNSKPKRFQLAKPSKFVYKDILPWSVNIKAKTKKLCKKNRNPRQSVSNLLKLKLKTCDKLTEQTADKLNVACEVITINDCNDDGKHGSSCYDSSDKLGSYLKAESSQASVEECQVLPKYTDCEIISSNLSDKTQNKNKNVSPNVQIKNHCSTSNKSMAYCNNLEGDSSVLEVCLSPSLDQVLCETSISISANKSDIKESNNYAKILDLGSESNKLPTVREQNVIWPNPCVCLEKIQIPEKEMDNSQLMKQQVNQLSSGSDYSKNQKCLVCSNKTSGKISEKMKIERLDNERSTRKTPSPGKVPKELLKRKKRCIEKRAASEDVVVEVFEISDQEGEMQLSNIKSGKFQGLTTSKMKRCAYCLYRTKSYNLLRLHLQKVHKVESNQQLTAPNESSEKGPMVMFPSTSFKV